MIPTFLFTSVHGLYIYDGKTRLITRDGAHFFGLTWDENFVYITERNNADVKNHKTCGKDTIGVFDRNFRRVGKIPNYESRDTHQLFCRDNMLYICNTHCERIDRLCLDNVNRTQHKYEKNPHKHLHINSIWYQDGFYVLEHLYGPSRIRLLNEQLKIKTSYNFGDQSHNLYKEGNIIYTLGSLHNKIIGFNEKERQVVVDKTIEMGDDLRWYPRGLGRTKDYWVIGQTVNQKKHPGREGQTCIVILDNNFEVVQKINSLDAFSIRDVRVIGELDLAHNGVDF